MRFLLQIIPLCSLFTLISAEESKTESTRPQSVRIPLPQGQSIEFVCVKIIKGNGHINHNDQKDKVNIFASRQFDMGYPDGSYNNPSLKVTVAGTIYREGYWMLPMAKTEITRGQYAALVSPDQMPDASQANLPMTNISYTDVINYIDKLNTYIYHDEEAKKALPSDLSNHGTAYIRLPLDTEWEFCARGGNDATKDLFEAKIPYPEGTLHEYENYTRNIDRGGKVRPVIGNRKPNPCGLYDMLGNVSEMVSPTYNTGFSMGRLGGLLVRGGNFRTLEKSITAYSRSEQSPYNEENNWKPFSASSVGFRLAIASTIATRQVNGDNDRIAEDWLNMQPRSLVHQPLVSQSASIDEKLQEEQRSIIERLNLILGAAEGANNANMEDSLKRIEQNVDNMKRIQREAQQSMAKAATSMIATASTFGNHTISLIEELNIAISHREQKRSMSTEEALRLKQLKARRDLQYKTLNNQWISLKEGIELLANVEPTLVSEYIEIKRKELEKKENELASSLSKNEQKHLFIISSYLIGIKFYHFYKQNNSLAGQRDKWVEELRKNHLR